MQWVKANLNLVITIAIGVLGITGLALGMVMSDVSQRMQQDQSTLSNLSSTRGSNAEAIEAARTYAQQVKAQLDKGLKEFESIGSHAPLLPDVFPKVSATDLTAPYRFKPAYRKALDDMLARLHAIDQPTETDFRIERELIQNQRERAARSLLMGTDPQTRPAGSGSRAPARPAPAPMPAGPGFGQLQPGRPMEAMTPEQLIQENEKVRASIKKARSGRCYANLNTFMLPDLLSRDEAPTVDAMWYAQMMLWIEQDIVGALASLNDAAAQALPAGEKPWVGNMPVKHLQRIIVGNYVPAPAAPGTTPTRSSSSGGTQGGPPNDANAVFTARGSQNGVDVVQSTLDIYLNPKYLPAVINAISKAGFYTTLLVSYEAVSPTTTLEGYVYGSQPVVRASLLFEGCFLRSKYEKWMPPEIQTAINEGRAAMGVGTPGGMSPAPGGGRMMPMDGPGVMPMPAGPGFQRGT